MAPRAQTRSKSRAAARFCIFCVVTGWVLLLLLHHAFFMRPTSSTSNNNTSIGPGAVAARHTAVNGGAAGNFLVSQLQAVATAVAGSHLLFGGQYEDTEDEMENLMLSSELSSAHSADARLGPGEEASDKALPHSTEATKQVPEEWEADPQEMEEQELWLEDFGGLAEDTPAHKDVETTSGQGVEALAVDSSTEHSQELLYSSETDEVQELLLHKEQHVAQDEDEQQVVDGSDDSVATTADTRRAVTTKKVRSPHSLPSDWILIVLVC